VARYAYLAYCRDVEEFVRLAGPLGRFLARRGLPLVVIDGSRPIKGGQFERIFKILKGQNNRALRI
jgi:hypothetical protein